MPRSPDARDAAAVPLLADSDSSAHPQFSGDGRWIADTSNESGVDEVYVQPYQATGEKWQVSIERVYVVDDRFVRSVTVDTHP